MIADAMGSVTPNKVSYQADKPVDRYAKLIVCMNYPVATSICRGSNNGG
jgi:hypothetical protein